MARNSIPVSYTHLDVYKRQEIVLEIKDNQIFFQPVKENKRNNSFWGLTRTLVNNMIIGVTEGYIKRLQLEGVGYRAVSEGNDLVFQLSLIHIYRRFFHTFYFPAAFLPTFRLIISPSYLIPFPL